MGNGWSVVDLARRGLGAAALLLLACAPDLRVDYPFDGTLPDGNYVTFEAQGDDTVTHVDATHKESWVYADLDTSKEVPGSEAVGTGEWDLAFQRFKIVSNGGVSGSGDVEVAALPGQDFDGLTQAPADGYLRDAQDGPDSNTDVDSAFLIGDGWYSYDLLGHKVQPRDIVYVVHTSHGFYKLQVIAYYDSAGTGGKVSFRWRSLPAPAQVP